MRKVFSVTGWQMRQLATEWADTGQKKSFQELLQMLYERGEYQSQPAALPVRERWDQLEPPAFFDLLWELPVVNPFSDWRPPGDVVAAEDLILTRQTVFGLVYIPEIVRRLHIHDFFEIDIVLRGSGRLSFEQQTKVCRAGDVCILFPGAHHDFEIGPEDIAVSLVVRQSVFASSFFDHLSPEAAGLFAAGTEGGPGCLVFSTGSSEDGLVFDDRMLFRLIEGIFQEVYQPDGYADGCAVSLMTLLLSELMRRHGDGMIYLDDQGGDAGMMRVLRYIEENYRTLTLSALAERFHYSPAYMSRLIKRHTGKNLVQLLTGLKMKRAQELLTHTGLRIDEVAEMAGYESTDHFSRQFKRMFGISPGSYRRGESG